MKNKRCILRPAAAILMALVLLFSDAAPGFAQEGAAGDRTKRQAVEVKEGDVEIADEEAFIRFAQECQNDFYSYGRTFVLTADLDLSRTRLECVAWFNGTFEGNGHTIANLRLSRKGSDYGLFRYVGNKGNIRNLTVTGEVNMDGSAENIGGIVGINFGRLENCSFFGSVSGKKCVGGIAGYNKADGLLYSCESSGTIQATNAAGGVCGENKGIITECVNRSTVNGDDLKMTLNLDGVDLGTFNLTQNVVTRNDTGGIAGRSSGTVSGCSNMGNIGFAHVGYNVGGIAGRQSGTLMSCENRGKILGRKDVGGIVGQAEPYRESEYLSDRLEKLKDDFSSINRLVVQMSDAMSATSSDSRVYIQTLQQQYEDTMERLNDEVTTLKDAVSENHQQTRDYIDSISQAIDNLGTIGNDTVKKVSDSIQSNVKKAADSIKDDVKDRVEELESKLEESTETESETTSAGESPEESESSGEQESSGGPESSADQESSGEEESSKEPEVSGEEESTEKSDAPKKSEEPPEPSEVRSRAKDSIGGAHQDGREQEEVPADAAAESLVYRRKTDAKGRLRYYSADSYDAQNVVLKGPNGWSVIECAETAESDSGSESKTESTEESSSAGIDIDKDEIKDKVDSIRDKLGQDKNRTSLRLEHDPEIDKNLDKMKGELNSVTENMKNLEGSITGTGDSVTEAASNISNELTDQSRISGETVDNLTDSIDGGIQSMTDSLNNIMNTSQKISNQVSADIDILMGNGNSLLDISSAKVTDKTLGVVSGCTNRGSVEADINTGGIAGMMNVEYDIDPELDLNLARFTDVEVRTRTNDVLIHCINYGKVNAKKNNCGGVAGSEELGLIHDCENYGSVRAESGNKLGGIAGMSTSRINKSYSFCNIEGQDYIGGIVGDGFDVSGCAAMSTLTADGGERIGGIAGHVDSEASVSANYFVYKGWDGLDHINYAGRAEAVSYEELMALDGIPGGFCTVTVTFEKDGAIAGTVHIPYGGSVEESDLPLIKAGEDSYLKWDVQFPLVNVTDNIKITAEDARWTKSLSSQQVSEEDKPYFLVEGNFYADSRVTASACEAPERGAAYAWSWEIENRPEEREDYTLHFLIPEGADTAELWVKRDGAWKAVKTQNDGSYVTASLACGECFAVYGKENGNTFTYMICAVAVAAAVLLLLMNRLGKNVKRKRKGRRTGKQKPE